ncbi:MAG: HAD-IA family hydrolase [bacterium]|nr:HAD-IA family hydrolase [bacterium]
MITTILSDFSRVILNPKDKNYKGTLNGLNKELSEKNTNYIFFDYFEFNDEILNLYRQLKTKYSVNIFTTGIIQNKSEVRRVIEPIFDNIYTAKDFGLDKKQSEAYLFITQKLNKKPNEILFIDDQEENTVAAQKAGLNTLLYVDFQKTMTSLKNKLDF